MNFIVFAACFKNNKYIIDKTFGFLLEFTNSIKGQPKLPKKVNDVFYLVINPYLLKTSSNNDSKISFLEYPYYTKFLAKLYTFLCLRSFIFVRIMSCFRFPIFNTSQEAILFYRKLFPYEQENLCLPRSLFAACTSKKFPKNGALFIGVFLPSRAMHAWIIEDACQPDSFDDIWICYQPVLVMYN